MELNIDAKFQGKMTCAFKNDLRNLAHFHQSMLGSLKNVTFIQCRKCMSLEFKGGFCVMTMKSDTKLKRDCHLSVHN